MFYRMGAIVTLTLKAGSLKLRPNVLYDFYVSTFFMNQEYGQRVLVEIVDTEQAPIVLIELSSLFFILFLIFSFAIYFDAMKVCSTL